MDHDQFHTTDIGLAAALVSCGNSIADVIFSDQKITHFVFDPSGQIKEDVERYWNDTLTVHARTMFEMLKAFEKPARNE